MMKLNPLASVGAVARKLENRERDGRTAHVAIATRVYDTTPEDLWNAFTDAERIPRWFLPISGELRVGGKYQFEGNAGGTITECTPPKQLAATWEYGGQVSWVTVRFSPEAAGGTRLELEHEAHVDDAFWNQYGPGATGVGWDLAFTGLERHLASGGAKVDPKEVEAWSVSDEGKAFIRASSDGWGQASIAAGTDPALALASAERTRCFYTGETPPAEGAEG